MLSKVIVDCMHGFPHGDKNLTRMGLRIFLSPQTGMGMGSGMGRLSRGWEWESNTCLGNPIASVSCVHLSYGEVACY